MPLQTSFWTFNKAFATLHFNYFQYHKTPPIVLTIVMKTYYHSLDNRFDCNGKFIALFRIRDTSFAEGQCIHPFRHA